MAPLVIDEKYGKATELVGKAQQLSKNNQNIGSKKDFGLRTWEVRTTSNLFNFVGDKLKQWSRGD